MATLSQPRPALADTRVEVDELWFVGGLMLLAAAAVHAFMAFEHASVLSHSAGFAAVATAQAVIGTLLMRGGAHERLFDAAALLCLAVAGAWLLSRVAGLPGGPTAWTPQPIGIADAITTADELLLVMLAGAARHRIPGLAGLEQLGLLVGALAFLSLFFAAHSH